MLCINCGAQIADSVKFCPVCGAKSGAQQTQDDGQEAVQPAVAWGAQQTQPAQGAAQATGTPAPGYAPEQQQSQPGEKKTPIKMIAIIAVIVAVLLAGGFSVYYFFIRDTDAPADISSLISADIPTEALTTVIESEDPVEETGPVELPFVSYAFMDKIPEAVIEFTTVDSVFPSNYHSLESLVVFTGYSDYGDLDVLIEVEVPGFTQQYKQKVTLGRQVTKMRIVPPLVTGTLDLSSEKTAQLVYSVTEVDSGKLLVQESKNIKLYSKFDMMWGDWDSDEVESWYIYADNILAWMTPNAPEVLSLKRDAIDYLSYISEGELDGIYGYQDYGYFDHAYYNTWVQAVAIQGAMSDIVGVRYNNSGFSIDAQQRVKLPADTLTTRSGICIETTLVMASALQSAGMHVMLLIPPGHAQVAVEAWPNTGDYFLIETTTLPMEQDNETWNYVVMYLTKDEWWGYISGEGDYTYGACYVVDCDLGEKLGIRAMSN